MATDVMAQFEHIVGGASAAYTTPLQRQAARRAIIWRHLKDNWTTQDLVTVLDALGLGKPPPPKTILTRRITSQIVWRNGLTVRLACGHSHRVNRAPTSEYAVCPHCSQVAS